MSAPRLELWQTEWCPASHRVRQRLTELGLTYIVHQVPVDARARAELERGDRRPRRSRSWSPSGEIVDGEQAILDLSRQALHRAAGRGRATRRRRPRQSERNWRKHVPS